MSSEYRETLDALGITVLERGWLSSNNTVVTNGHSAWIIDTGYGSHSVQTVELVAQAIGDMPLLGILNTHLHSDHCGGNAALKAKYPQACISIPPGQAEHVRNWNPVQLTYQPTGQQCPPFDYNEVLEPGSELLIGCNAWQIHAAPGHDPHAVVLFQPDARVLVSGDALWENGFGVVFPELEGFEAFTAVGETLDLIEQLTPRVVIPGHGRPFAQVEKALERARNRLEQFQRAPDKHSDYAAKVLIKFHLLECQRTTLTNLEDWYRATPYFGIVKASSPELDLSLERLLSSLVASKAVRTDREWVFDN